MFEENKSLKPYTTFAVAVNARYFAAFSNVEELQDILASQIWQNNKHMILGGGSNILFTQDFDGVIVKNEMKGIETITETDTTVTLRVAAGEDWTALVRQAASHGYWGIENLALIPGTVGSSVVQNIGAYGVEVESVVETVQAFDTETQEILSLSKEACEFGYRMSLFKQHDGRYVILSVDMVLQKQGQAKVSYGSLASMLEEKGIAEPTVMEMVETVSEVRRSKLPNVGEIGMAGSFFKNPVISPEHFEELQKQFPHIRSFELPDGALKIPAGWLIEELGYKGVREGKVGTYEKHALVLVNESDATGQEVWNFAQKIMSHVKKVFGIDLEPEVLII